MHPKSSGKTGSKHLDREIVQQSHTLSSVSHVLFGDELIVILGWWERRQETRHRLGILMDRYKSGLKSSADTDQIKPTAGVNAKKLAANFCG